MFEIPDIRLEGFHAKFQCLDHWFERFLFFRQKFFVGYPLEFLQKFSILTDGLGHGGIFLHEQEVTMWGGFWDHSSLEVVLLQFFKKIGIIILHLIQPILRQIQNLTRRLTDHILLVLRLYQIKLQFPKIIPRDIIVLMPLVIMVQLPRVNVNGL